METFKITSPNYSGTHFLIVRNLVWLSQDAEINILAEASVDFVLEIDQQLLLNEVCKKEHEQALLDFLTTGVLEKYESSVQSVIYGLRGESLINKLIFRLKFYDDTKTPCRLSRNGLLESLKNIIRNATLLSDSNFLEGMLNSLNEKTNNFYTELGLTLEPAYLTHQELDYILR